MSEVEVLGSHMAVILPLLQERAALTGDVAEFGVYAGATTVQLAQFGRTVWAFDTFNGIPAASFTPGLDRDEPGKFDAPEDIFERLRRYPNIRPVIGTFEQGLEHVEDATRGMAPVKIVLAYVDCDLYISAQCALAWLAKRVVPGGVIVIDDYATHPGIQKAVAQFLAFNLAWFRFDGDCVIYRNESKHEDQAA